MILKSPHLFALSLIALSAICIPTADASFSRRHDCESVDSEEETPGRPNPFHTQDTDSQGSSDSQPSRRFTVLSGAARHAVTSRDRESFSSMASITPAQRFMPMQYPEPVQYHAPAVTHPTPVSVVWHPEEEAERRQVEAERALRQKAREDFARADIERKIREQEQGERERARQAAAAAAAQNSATPQGPALLPAARPTPHPEEPIHFPAPSQITLQQYVASPPPPRPVPVPDLPEQYPTSRPLASRPMPILSMQQEQDPEVSPPPYYSGPSVARTLQGAPRQYTLVPASSMPGGQSSSHHHAATSSTTPMVRYPEESALYREEEPARYRAEPLNRSEQTIDTPTPARSMTDSMASQGLLPSASRSPLLRYMPQRVRPEGELAEDENVLVNIYQPLPERAARYANARTHAGVLVIQNIDDTPLVLLEQYNDRAGKWSVPVGVENPQALQTKTGRTITRLALEVLGNETGGVAAIPEEEVHAFKLLRDLPRILVRGERRDFFVFALDMTERLAGKRFEPSASVQRWAYTPVRTLLEAAQTRSKRIGTMQLSSVFTEFLHTDVAVAVLQAILNNPAITTPDWEKIRRKRR